MGAGTSPSITTVSGGGGLLNYQIAFQANTGTLYSYDHHVEIQNGRTFDSNLNTGFGMDPGSSPSTTSTS